MRSGASLLLLALLLPGAAAADARVRGLGVEVDGHRVLVALRLEDGFDRELAERVASGLPISFEYEFELLRDRKRWFDRPLQSSSLEVTARFDAVAREYLVDYKLDGELVESRIVRDPADLRRAMTELGGLPIFNLEPLPRRWRLLVKARAVLGSRSLFSFLPTRAATDWQESKKFWAPQELMPPP